MNNTLLIILLFSSTVMAGVWDSPTFLEKEGFKRAVRECGFVGSNFKLEYNRVKKENDLVRKSCVDSIIQQKISEIESNQQKTHNLKSQLKAAKESLDCSGFVSGSDIRRICFIIKNI